MFWRVFIFQFPSYQPVLLETFSANPLKAVFEVAFRIVEDAYTATWGAWTEFFKFPNHTDLETASGKVFWAAVCLSLLAVLIAAFLYRPDEDDCPADEDPQKAARNWCLIAMGLGAFMVICPGMPYWVTSLPVKLSYPYDRFLVAFWFGASIFMVGLVGFFIRTRIQRNVLLSLFVAMAVGGNILNANSFRKDWNMQKSFTSQLVTRIPSLEKSTILLSDDNPLVYESDNSLTGLVNLALAPDHKGDDLPYSVLLFSPRFGTIENYKTYDTIYQMFRSSTFGAKNDQVVVYHYSPPGCLRILDPEIHSDLLKILPDSYRNFLELSDPKGRIDPNGTAKTFLWDEIYKQPIEQNWCYWFQKADLARQTEDWETIAAIGDEVLPKMKAGEASEYFIFIESYIKLNRWEDAMKTFTRVYAEEKDLDATLCRYLRRWIGHNPPEDEEIIWPLIEAMNSVGCSLSKD